MNRKLPLVACLLTAFSASSWSLNIVLTNDDSYATDNVQIAFEKLKAAGHDVILSAPCLGQSGKGGSINFLAGVNVERVASDQYCVGDKDTSLASEDFVSGTPVMAALYGIDILAKSKWGNYPDLVVSGPNEGNNLGYITNNSGTIGAANMAIARNIPTIAISADSEDEATANLVVDVLINVIDELVEQQTEGEALLPNFTGLNINTPQDMANNKGIQFTNVGWNTNGLDATFTQDLSTDPVALNYVAQKILQGAPQLSLEQALAYAASTFTAKENIGGISASITPVIVDENPASEGVALKQDYITISTIDGSIQATKAKVALTRLKLNALVN